MSACRVVYVEALKVSVYFMSEESTKIPGCFRGLR